MPTAYFTDRDLGKKFPDILRAAGLSVERHADHFAQDCPDPDWLREIGNRGWVSITHDGRIRYKPNELAAVVEHRVALLVMIGHARSAAAIHPSCESAWTPGSTIPSLPQPGSIDTLLALSQYRADSMPVANAQTASSNSIHFTR